jgi:predicted TIM-barrel fold metal-dependent hydrolase
MAAPDVRWMISADDHVVEPPNVWQDRLPAKHRELGPKLVRDGDQEFWQFEGKRRTTRGLEATAGKSFEQYSPLPLTYADMRPGCYDVVERIKDMDQDGILASVVFPSFPRFAGQVFSEASDRELGFACIQAYNDWMIDEWCGYAPSRFIPMTMIPFWDPKLAAQEIERCADKGARCITFSENPSPLGFPSLQDPEHYWDPVFSACAEAGLVINMHAGSSSQLPRTSPDMPHVESLVLGMMSLPAAAALDFIFSDTFVRHPKLKICLSEGGIGWIPVMLERCDRVYERHLAWAKKYNVRHTAHGTTEERPVPDFDGRRPTEIFRNHIYGCFFEDFRGVEGMQRIGLLDNIVMESDYPHSDSSWPNTIPLARRQVADLTQEEAEKLMIGNSSRLYRFEPPKPPLVQTPELAGSPS